MSLLRSRVFHTVLSLGISLLALYLALRHTDGRDFWSLVGHVDPWFVALACLSVALNTAGKAVRWQWLLGSERHNVPLSLSLGALLVGQLLNNVFPARVGDLGRAHLVGRTGPGSVFTLATIVNEKLIDTIIFGSLCGVLLLSMPLPHWIARGAVPLVVGGLLGSMLLAILIYPRHRSQALSGTLLRLVPVRLRATVSEYGRHALRGLRNDRSTTVHILLWSAVVWTTALATNYLVARAVGLRLPPVSALLILVVLQIAITIPSVPGTVGVWEYVCILALALFSVGRTSALGYGVLLHVIVFVPTSLAGLLCFWKLGPLTTGGRSAGDRRAEA